MTRLLLRTTTAVALALLLPACSDLGDDSPQEQASTAEAERLADELDELPGVGDVQVVYARSASNDGDVTVLVPLEPGADGPAVVEAAVRAVWTSRIDPLGSIVVSATDAADRSRDASEEHELSTDTPELRRRFGPRPEGVADGG